MSARRSRRAAEGPHTVGRVIAEGLAAAGVRWAFTVPGESFLGVLDALPDAGIRVVATRHEGGAAFMAEAVGNLTGKPAAVLGTRAVGAGNMAIGIHTARQNSSPLVALVGQVQRAFSGREAFQEADLVTTVGGLAKWAAQLDDPADAARLVAEGLGAMLSGRPGPVLFSLPEDVLDIELPAGTAAAIEPQPPAEPDGGAVEAVVELLTRAQRPLIMAGGGVLAAGARAALVELSERLEVPVVAAWRRPGVFPNDHPHYLGMTGYGAPATVRRRLEETDALLVIGCRLNEIASFEYAVPAAQTRWAQVDLEPRAARAGLRGPDLALASDAARFLDRALALGATYKAPRERIEGVAADRQAYLTATTVAAAAEWRGPGIDPARAMATLQAALPENAILTSDAGNFALWAARYLRLGAGNAFLGPTSGAMGYGLPAAIAASLCEPERQVVALCGDGGLAMTMNELETAVRERSRLVVLVFDNRRYGTIAMHQANEQRQPVATDLGPIDFAAVARACGAQGGRVTRDVELAPALRDALAADRPALIQLELDPRWVTPDRYDG